MFTGIIESPGVVKDLKKEGSNLQLTIASDISNQLKIDQSIAHNGVCLTVIAQTANTHVVTAIDETLVRSNLGTLEVGDRVNLERCMTANGRLDGHIVQGHVDTTGVCTKVESLDGSWYFHFEYEANENYILVDKGSICVNGVSLTVVEPTLNTFKVAIIPYTFEHTNFKSIKAGVRVNLEFDIIGKYISKYAALYLK